MKTGSSAARYYGYSSARAKTMGSSLLSRSEIQSVIDAKDASFVLSLLAQGDYRKDLEEFGGVDTPAELIDFALSKNLARNVTKLVNISPFTERKIMRAIVGKWNLYNIRIAIEAKDKKQEYDSIARYIIDYGRYDGAVIKEAMREETVEGMLARLMINSPYGPILQTAIDEYKNTRSTLAAIAVMDKGYYKTLGSVMTRLRNIDGNSARIVKMDIDMKNILLLLRAKRMEAKFSDISESIINGGGMDIKELENLYSSSNDIESLVSQISAYDLKPSLEVYKADSSHRMITFEIGLRNAIFLKSISILNHSILSFGAMLAYAYMKEIEIFMLRILINSKLYGLSSDETSKLITWRE